jgi:hypothetical protein
MYWYGLGVEMYVYLWIEAMKAPLWHFEGVTSGAHNAPEQL